MNHLWFGLRIFGAAAVRLGMAMRTQEAAIDIGDDRFGLERDQELMAQAEAEGLPPAEPRAVRLQPA